MGGTSDVLKLVVHPGSEGGQGGVATVSTNPTTASTNPTTASTTNSPRMRAQGAYRGLVTITEGAAWLDVGALRMELFVGLRPTDDRLADERKRSVARFRPYDGQLVSLLGRQQGGCIALALVPDERPLQYTTARLSPEHTAAFEAIVQWIKVHGAAYVHAHPEVVRVRPGYRFRDAWFDGPPTPALVVEARPVRSRAAQEEDLLADPALAEMSVSLAWAPPERQVDARVEELALPMWYPLERGGAEEMGGEEARLLYTPPDIALDEITAAMTVTCHVSPESGWPTLKGFLERTRRDLTVAMYDFTAPHILQSVKSVMRDASGALSLVLDPKVALSSPGGDNPKADDVREEVVRDELRAALGDRFEFEWAAITSAGKVTAGLFANSYHIKVAVADSRATWLSSGNWQSSNQPDVDVWGVDSERADILGRYNREWHVVFESREISRLFEGFIKWDIAQAAPLQADAVEGAFAQGTLLVPDAALERSVNNTRYFAPLRRRYTRAEPLRVQPLLTPDNYQPKVLELIESARERLYFQNQYINVGKRPRKEFSALIDALVAKSRSIDVRIILRDLPNAREMLESLAGVGFDPALIRLQPNTHTKGIIVDGQAVMIGSHNWSSSGTLENRDASVILYDADFARYFEEIFLHDWEHLARQRVSSEDSYGDIPGMPRVADGDEAAVDGVSKVTWSTVYDGE